MSEAGSVECRHQYEFWTKSTGPEPGEPMTCWNCGAIREPGRTIRLDELHPIARRVVLALIAAQDAMEGRRHKTGSA